MEQVMVKNIADKIGCSVQPIYSYCKNMDGLRQEVIERVNAFIQEYVEALIDREDLFRSIGQSYIQLAKEEPYLYRIFILLLHWTTCINPKPIRIRQGLLPINCRSAYRRHGSCI